MSFGSSASVGGGATCAPYNPPDLEVVLCDCSSEECGGDGDETACGDGECNDYVSDPVHISTGAFVTEPITDLELEGAEVAVRFTRRYTSLDAWPIGRLIRPVGNTYRFDTTRLGFGWFHTYDERLFASDRRSAITIPWGSAFQVVHRTAEGSGRRYSCSAPASPGDFECSTTDGSLDPLQWVNAANEWRVYQGDEVARFAASGRLLGHAAYSACPRPAPPGAFTACSLASHEHWNVAYVPDTDPFGGNIQYVQDHLGRRINFVWAIHPRRGEIIERITDTSGASLVQFQYTTDSSFHLTGVDGRVSERYDGGTSTHGGYTYVVPFITAIRRQNAVTGTWDAITTVEYTPFRGAGRVRVRRVHAQDGSYELRYRNETNNSCPASDRSTQIVDLSLGTASCTSDAACTGSNEVCAIPPGATEGVCRPYTCQGYLMNGSTVEVGSPSSVSESCACSGSDDYRYQTSTSFPPRVTVARDRQGTITTMAYDSLGRLTARCVGDSGNLDAPGQAVVTTDPASCPSSGVFTRWTYGTVGTDVVHASQIRFVETRSALLSGLVPTEYVYSMTSGRVLQVRRDGFTRTLADANVLETRVTSYEYGGPFGRLSAVVGPAGDRTEYEYWTTPGTDYGMLRLRRELVGSAALTTLYSDYTSTGRPQLLIEPSGANHGFIYQIQGLRLIVADVAGLGTAFQYDSSGRVTQIVEPTGRRTTYTYGTQGRLARTDVFDSGGSGQADRTTYTYDARGRRTRVQLQRVSSTGTVLHTSQDVQATYDRFDNQSTLKLGPQLPTTFTYDPAALGYLSQAQRGDGNLEEHDQDAFGRDAWFRRTFATGVTGQHAFSYNELGGANSGGDRPTQITDPAGRVRTYTYDDFGQVVRSDSAAHGTVRWRWEMGRLRDTRWADGRRTAFFYDQLGRVTTIDNDADAPAQLGQDYIFYYDNDGSLPCIEGSCTFRRGRLAYVDIENTPGTFWRMHYNYNAFGAVLYERWHDGRTTRYTYDSLGRLQRVQSPSSANFVRYEYDSTAGDGLDASEVVKIVGERSGVGDYVNWAQNIQRDAAGNLTSVVLHDATASLASTASYRTDGRLSCMLTRRRSGTSTAIKMVDRCYGYSADGTVTGHDSLVAADSPRTFLYDGGNRLTCATNVTGSTTCPTGSTLVESYGYNSSDDLTSRASSAGSTSFAYLPGGVSIWDEYPPSRTILYQPRTNLGGVRDWDRESTSGAPSNQRTYTYDAQGRLRVIAMPRPGSAAGSGQQNHTISVLYDHRARPIYVVSRNEVTGSEDRTTYYYDLDDRPMMRLRVPSSAVPTTYTIDTYVHIDPLVVGNIRTEHTTGGSSETLLYHALSPEGLPVTGWSFNRTTFATSEVYRAQYTPFGRRTSLTGSADLIPPQRFPGQLEIPASAAQWWNGTTLVTSREPLVLNRWRVYDPRLGQYLQPEPLLIEGDPRADSTHPYGYSFLAPGDYSDPDGRFASVVVGGGIVVCAFGLCEAAFVLSAAAVGWVISEGINELRDAIDDPTGRMCTFSRTRNVSHACAELGISPADCRRAIHAIKAAAGLRGADDIEIDTTTGDVFDASGDWIGNLYDD